MQNGKADDGLQPLHRTHNHDAVRERASRGDVEVIARCFRWKLGRPIGRNAVAKAPSMDHPLPVKLGRRLDLAAPRSVDHQFHRIGPSLL
jgi:hypothetical protein